MPEQPKDAYLWRAWYDDDSHLDEHAEDGSHHRFADIDQTRLVEFQLLPQREGLPTHGLHLTGERRLIWRRDTSIDANGPRAGIPRTLHIMGWQMTIEHGDWKRNVKNLIAVTETGTTFTTDQDEALQP